MLANCAVMVRAQEAQLQQEPPAAEMDGDGAPEAGGPFSTPHPDDVGPFGEKASAFRERMTAPLYAGARAKLGEVINVLMDWKRRTGCKDTAFGELLGIMQGAVLPPRNLLPPSTYLMQEVLQVRARACASSSLYTNLAPNLLTRDLIPCFANLPLQVKGCSQHEHHACRARCSATWKAGTRGAHDKCACGAKCYKKVRLADGTMAVKPFQVLRKQLVGCFDTRVRSLRFFR